MSKEHFWPEWLAPHLSPTAVNAHISELHVGEGKQPVRLKKRMERQGTVNTKKIRVVCAKCNNGWMSVVESSAKSVLLGLLNNRLTLSIEETMTLSQWVAIKSIIGEHATESTALTPPVDRQALYEHREIPGYFRFFVALHSLESAAAYHRHSTTVSRSLGGPLPALPEGITRNIQTTSFLVGRLCFYTVAIRASGVDPALLDPTFPMHCIWPVPGQSLDLGATHPLGAFEVYRISRSLERLVQHPRVRYGGPLPPVTRDATYPP